MTREYIGGNLIISRSSGKPGLKVVLSELSISVHLLSPEVKRSDIDQAALAAVAAPVAASAAVAAPAVPLLALVRSHFHIANSNSCLYIPHQPGCSCFSTPLTGFLASQAS